METYIKLEKLGEVCIVFFWNDYCFDDNVLCKILRKC